ncbi:hypothetical protein CCMA1212_004291 [Trichoderma ghanense]|uniref:Uncharacterized protein n=1 Tax=Trichoderma ghanense TaxID=65468 RepID=A0ABY2H6W1_9HYPO
MEKRNTSSITPDEADIVTTTIKTLTRQEIDRQIDWSLFAIFADPPGKETDEYSAKFAADLAPQKVKKTWNPSHERKRYGFQARKLWSPKHPIAKVLDELEEASRKLKAEDGTLFETKIKTIRQFIEWEEERVEHQEFEAMVDTLDEMEHMAVKCLKRLKKE